MIKIILHGEANFRRIRMIQSGIRRRAFSSVPSVLSESDEDEYELMMDESYNRRRPATRKADDDWIIP
jgi:hypothetical protein